MYKQYKHSLKKKWKKLSSLFINIYIAYYAAFK